MGTIKTTNIEPIADNGTVTLGSSGDTFTVPSGVTITNNGTQTGFGGTNTPAFLAYLGSSQSIGTSQTKVNMNTEVYDTNGKYDTSTYRFTPTVAGKYFVFVQYRIESPGTNDSQVIKLFENGGEVVKGEVNSATNRDHTVQLSTVRVLDDNDYLEVYSYNSNTKTLNPGQGNTFWGAYKIIE